jgi:hypothetical protein
VYCWRDGDGVEEGEEVKDCEGYSEDGYSMSACHDVCFSYVSYKPLFLNFASSSSQGL